MFVNQSEKETDARLCVWRGEGRGGGGGRVRSRAKFFTREKQTDRGMCTVERQGV